MLSQHTIEMDEQLAGRKLSARLEILVVDTSHEVMAEALGKAVDGTGHQLIARCSGSATEGAERQGGIFVEAGAAEMLDDVQHRVPEQLTEVADTVEVECLGKDLAGFIEVARPRCDVALESGSGRLEPQRAGMLGRGDEAGCGDPGGGVVLVRLNPGQAQEAAAEHVRRVE